MFLKQTRAVNEAILIESNNKLKHVHFQNREL